MPIFENTNLSIKDERAKWKLKQQKNNGKRERGELEEEGGGRRKKRVEIWNGGINISWRNSCYQEKLKCLV